MLLTSGTRLGPYEIVARVGAGGMGEVYKAIDTRLNRTVAIKVSQERFSDRFEREAHAIALLNHPHVCQLYDVGPDYLVMEFLEGKPLKGPLSVEQTIQYAGQILDALDAAHRKGITHRDLKPGNILITSQGVKLLDFGLAKQDHALREMDETHTAGLTAKGQIIGTLQYMAPEQLQGKEADARSDLFSFGCVLHEMATGKRAFHGQNAASVIAAILEREPEKIGISTPLDRLVKRCLAKNPDERFQNARDVKIALDWALEEPATAHSKFPWLLALVSGAAVVVAIVITAWLTGRFRPPDQPYVQSFILPPTNTSFRCVGDDAGPVVLSPDGKRLAFAANGTDGKFALWIRALDSVHAQLIPGTDGAMFPFWSPDSRYVGFFADTKLKKVDAAGTAVSVLSDAPAMRGGAWGRDDVILFSPRLTSPIFRTSASGGPATPVTTLDPKQQDISHRWPSFLPDGKHFVYTSRGRGVFVASLDSTEAPRRLLEESSNAIYSSGFLLYSRENTLLARPFDAAAMKFTGPAEVLAQSLTAEILSDRACFSASETGVLAYHSGVNEAQLTWFDRKGNRVGTLGHPGLIDGVELSPDGKQAAVTIGDSSGRGTVWLYELARGVNRRFVSIDRYNVSLLWSKDSRRIAIGERTDGRYRIRMKDAGGSGRDEVIYQTDIETQLGGWGPDGGLTLSTRNPNTGWDLDYLPSQKKNERATPVSVLHQPGDEMLGSISPDGHWILYTHSEPGDIDLYPHVAAFPGGGQNRLIARDATGMLRWNANGNEIFYATHSKLMAVDVRRGGDTLQIGAPHLVFPFRGDCNTMYVGSCFDVATDGARFLVAESIGSPPPVALIQNWRAGLRK